MTMCMSTASARTSKTGAELAVRVSDRHFGIGSDGLILICPSDIADAKMRMFNADGSEPRCAATASAASPSTSTTTTSPHETEFSVPGLGTFPTSLRIETGRGILTVGLELDENDKVSRVCVNMGQPILESPQIPVAVDAETVTNLPLSIDGQDLTMTCVSMGNPHAVFLLRGPGTPST
jgi:diaminopimelate epimerase